MSWNAAYFPALHHLSLTLTLLSRNAGVILRALTLQLHSWEVMEARGQVLQVGLGACECSPTHQIQIQEGRPISVFRVNIEVRGDQRCCAVRGPSGSCKHMETGGGLQLLFVRMY